MIDIQAPITAMLSTSRARGGFSLSSDHVAKDPHNRVARGGC